jgi:nucleoside-diphosphate-sugar epimerase
VKLKGRHYLVTGGTGFIGAGLVKGLLASGARVRTFDNDSRGSKEKLGHAAEHVEMLAGDIRDAEAVSKALKGVDAVCHLAYVNGTEFFYSKAELILDVAVRGMLNVIDGCRHHGVRELVLASSSEVYQAPPKVPTDETVPLTVPDVLNPRFSYGGGKIISELMAVVYGKNHFDRVLIFRPHNVYGPDMGWEHVIPQFALRLHHSNLAQPEGVLPFAIQGTGHETRSFIFIDDMIDGLLKVIECGEHFGIYNVGSGIETTVAELAHEMARQLGRKIELQAGKLQPGSTQRRCPDIRKLQGLGFTPRTTLSEGLRKTLGWYIENADKNPNKTS